MGGIGVEGVGPSVSAFAVGGQPRVHMEVSVSWDDSLCKARGAFVWWREENAGARRSGSGKQALMSRGDPDQYWTMLKISWPASFGGHGGREFDQEGEADDVGLKFFEEASDSGGSSACCEEVVDDEDTFVRLDIFRRGFRGCRSHLEFVAFLESFVGEFAGFTDRYEADTEAVGKRSAKDKATGFDADDFADLHVFVMCGEQFDDMAEGSGVCEQGGGCPEQDTGFGEVRDIADVVEDDGHGKAP